ncbi:uncharacterized protein G2W53_041229 [Senna tora]|uniref:Uncharacterized protein n=1 Tax=Senna tora TaxID=362788 RepID=A0A834SEI1_9FABA|nr:uncharacterized protein G2W53_041229 [Senna tora]
MEWIWCSNWSRQGMEGEWIMSYHIPDKKSRSDLRNVHEVPVKSLVAHHIVDEKLWSNLRNHVKVRVKSLVLQLTDTEHFVLYLRNRVDLVLELESSSHGRSVDRVLSYSR